MVRLYDMFSTAARHHLQTSSYGLGHQAYALQYPQYDDIGAGGSVVDVDTPANSNPTNFQSCSWPAVYAVATNHSNRQQSVFYDDWMTTTTSNQCPGGQQSFAYNMPSSGFHLQRDVPSEPTDYSMQNSGMMLHQGTPLSVRIDGGPSPDSATAVSSDMSGSESPGLNLDQGAQGLCKPQQARSPFEWMKRTSYQSQPNPGKTRTKDKYRVVYTDHQRLELEKEFHYSRYITIRRKTELASLLGLSERQVKIWFQNRRAKERKQAKKREEMIQKDKDQKEQPYLQPNAAFAALNSIFKPMVHFDTENRV